MYYFEFKNTSYYSAVSIQIAVVFAMMCAYVIDDDGGEWSIQHQKHLQNCINQYSEYIHQINDITRYVGRLLSDLHTNKLS